MPDDSDGILSLALQWQTGWSRRDRSSLPPNWIRLEFAAPSGQSITKPDGSIKETVSNTSKPAVMDEEAHWWQSVVAKGHRDSCPDPLLLPPEGLVPTSLDFELISSPTSPFLKITSPTYACRQRPPIPATQPSVDGTRPTTNWLAPLSFMFGLSTSCPISSLALPRALRGLSLASSVPCGVLVLAKLLSLKDAPEWESLESPKSDHLATHERFVSQSRAIARERLLPEAQRQQAAALRRDDELAAMGTRVRQEQRERAEKEEKRQLKAVNSTRMQIDLVANAALEFLESESLLEVRANNQKDPFQNAVEQLLLGIYGADVGINNTKWALDACAMLDRWRDWVERGGMTTADLRAIVQDKKAFCWAAVAVGLVTQVCEKDGLDGEGLLSDVRECFRVYNVVRLG
ncbi:MAG: hypothetical protein Q9168_004175 [Polycauliona sp. 1 TL-2023]